jgi:hypothetical protein
MDYNEKNNQQDGVTGNQAGCDCEGNCCPPKKKSPLRSVIFGIVILAALGIVAFKIFGDKPAAAAGKSCCPPGSAATCDTTGAKADTAKKSSCCPE